MPEYLSPGVYVEEFEIGGKPIEGVSTSTTGFVGMTEMGTIDKPTLVTNFGEYQRIFGGYLGEKDEKGNLYNNELNEKEKFNLRMLPYSVEGFFSNGGQRLYVTRVADKRLTIKNNGSEEDNKNVAKKSSCNLPNISGKALQLMDDINPNDRILKISSATDLKKDIPLLLKDDKKSEYLKYESGAKALELNSTLTSSYEKTVEIKKFGKPAGDYTIQKKVDAGTSTIELNDVQNLQPNDFIIIDDGTKEICIIETVDTGTKTIKVKKPLQEHLKDAKLYEPTEVSPAVKTNPITGLNKGSSVIPVDVADTKFNKDEIIKIGEELFFIKNTESEKAILLAEGVKYQHEKDVEIMPLIPAISVEAANEGTWGDKIKIIIRDSSISKVKLIADAPKDQNYLDLNTVSGIETGTMLKSPDGYAVVKEVVNTDDTKRANLVSKISNKINAEQEISTVEFDMIVRFDVFEEVFKNLSMNEKHSRYVKKIITPETSNLIRIAKVYEKPEAADNIIMSTQDKEPGWKLEGGNNGIPLSAGDLNEIFEGKDNDEPENRTGLYTLKNIDDISIVAIPGITTQRLQNLLIIHCQTLKDRFAVLDSISGADLNAIQAQRNLYDSKFAAIYYPWIRAFDPVSKKPMNVPPSGYVCGVYARSDTERGVHKAPANEVVSGALDLEEVNPTIGTKRIITKGQQDILNPKGINCIRVFPGRGIRVWGARTISSDPLWKYINIRRLFIYVEESIYKGTQWVVFEPNNEKLWGRVKATIDDFLTRVWRDGALMGLKADEAFFIKCDRTTMTQGDIDNGRLICIIGIAPVKPAEFVIFRIAQWAGGAAAKE